MTKLESGRSMVEMLGVLAIIGVLSIGGIAGYSMAMDRNAANNITDAAAKLSIIGFARGQSDTAGNVTAAEAGITLPSGATSMTSDNNGIVTVVAEETDVANIINQMGQSVSGNTITFNFKHN